MKVVSKQGQEKLRISLFNLLSIAAACLSLHFLEFDRVLPKSSFPW